MITTLLELQRLKRLDRTGWPLRGLPAGAESVAAHTFGVAVVALLLADEVRGKGVEVDVERVLRLALLHDWAEARLGDLPRAASHYLGAEVRKRAESAAFGDMVEPLGPVGEDYRVLHEEYEARRTTEARLVKAADTIDLLTQALAFERAGSRGLDEFWEVARGEPDFGLSGAAAEVVRGALHNLLAERAKLT